ncbi:nickel pincer cofactor biosynthesis protein LarC [Candidatus Nitrospira bockiana]
MAHLHFDCFSGISGDMTLGALVDAGLPLKSLAHALKDLRLDGYRLRAKSVTRGGLEATKVDVQIDRGLARPLSLSRIERLIRESGLPQRVKDQGHRVFRRLAEAEGLAHRVRPADVVFHEVGVIDSLVDVIGSLLGCHLLGVTRVTASPVNLGSGLIDSSHGTLPAPGPAVAALSRGLPVYSAGPARELTTPTGLALLATLTAEFGPLPLMRPQAIGYGAGSADPAGWPNVLRVFLAADPPVESGERDTIVRIETNIDDLTPQVYETVMERLFAVGAVDVTLTAVIMKHGRPGIVLTALAPPPKSGAVVEALLRETSTIGVRVQEIARWVLPRRSETVRTPSGPVRMKVVELGQGRTKASPEYVDCRRIAEQTGRPVREILEEAALAWARLGRDGKRSGSKPRA